MTTFLWDASDFDWGRGPMNLGAAKDAGISGFTHKATEGTSVQHAHYGEALARARAAGIPVLGAYHVVRTGDVAAELSWHLKVLDRETPWWRDWPDWLLQVDLEKWPYDTVSAATGEAFAHLEAATGRRPVIYASKGQYGDQLVGPEPLWNANYPSGLAGSFVGLYARVGGDKGPGWATYGNGRTPILWQYTSSATIGSQPGCDASAFRGTLDQLKAALRPMGAAAGATQGDDVALTDKVPNSSTPDHTDDRTANEILGDAAKERAALQGVLTPAQAGFKDGSPLASLVAVPGRLTALETAVTDMPTALARIEAAQTKGAVTVTGGAAPSVLHVTGDLSVTS